MKGGFLQFKPTNRILSILLAVILVLLAGWLLTVLGKREGFQEGAINKSIGGAKTQSGSTTAKPKPK